MITDNTGKQIVNITEASTGNEIVKIVDATTGDVVYEKTEEQQDSD